MLFHDHHRRVFIFLGVVHPSEEIEVTVDPSRKRFLR